MGDSSPDMRLVTSWNSALASATVSGSSAAQPKRPLPGRITSSAPTKATTTSAQRRADTCSRSTSGASSVTNTGASITTAVNSASGITRSA
jgi:hypothetical protein